nr:unnamed protein product [Callosobruchus chinensis]
MASVRTNLSCSRVPALDSGRKDILWLKLNLKPFPKPSLEYCSHIWGAAAPTTLSILDAVQRRAIRLIGHPALTCHLQPLSHRRAVGDLSLFYQYTNGFCSSELTSIIPSFSKPARYPRNFFSPQGGRSSYIKN